MRKGAALWIGGLATIVLSEHAVAHPHVFIDTGLEVVFDQAGWTTGIRVTWTYDEFYSLMIMEERQLDMDGDGHLTDPEKAGLAGFDMDWKTEYPGDTYALADDVPLGLSRPSDFTADIRDGRIVSTHLRKLEPPFRPEATALVVKSYDPSYYFSYTIPRNAALAGAPDCSSTLFPADPTVAKDKARSFLTAYSKGGGLDQNFPRIGEFFADEVKVKCITEQPMTKPKPVPMPVAPDGGSDCWLAWFWLPC